MTFLRISHSLKKQITSNVTYIILYYSNVSEKGGFLKLLESVSREGNIRGRGSKIYDHIKVLVAKPGDRGSIPRSHKVKTGNQLQEVICLLTPTCVHLFILSV